MFNVNYVLYYHSLQVYILFLSKANNSLYCKRRTTIKISLFLIMCYFCVRSCYFHDYVEHETTKVEALIEKLIGGTIYRCEKWNKEKIIASIAGCCSISFESKQAWLKTAEEL